MSRNIERLNSPSENKNDIVLLGDFYRNDDQLYILWSLIKGTDYLNHKKFDMRYLIPPNWTYRKTLNSLIQIIDANNITLEDLIFNRELYMQYCIKEYDSKNNENKLDIKFRELFDKNKFDIHDFQFVATESVLEFVDFKTELSLETRNKLFLSLNEYIYLFTHNIDIVNSDNCFSYDRHYEIVMPILKELYNNFGEIFSVKKSDFSNSKSFLFIHFLIAFECLEYIEFVYKRTSDDDRPLSEQIEEYTIKIKITEKLISKFQDESEVHIPETSTEERADNCIYQFKEIKIDSKNGVIRNTITNDNIHIHGTTIYHFLNFLISNKSICKYEQIRKYLKDQDINSIKTDKEVQNINYQLGNKLRKLGVTEETRKNLILTKKGYIMGNYLG